MSLQSSNQDSSLEDEKAKEDRPSSSHFSTRSETIQMKKNLAMTSRRREKYTTTTSGILVRTPSTGSIKPEYKAKDHESGRQGLAIIVYNSVPADCIYKVISQKGGRTSCERLSASRPAPKIVLKIAWQWQQQQQQQHDTSESSASSTRKVVQSVQECRERTKVLQQTTQNHRAFGNRCQVLSHLLRKKSLI